MRPRNSGAMSGGSRYAPQAGGTPRTPTLPLPLEYTVQAGVSQEDVFRNGIRARGLRDAVFLTATRANDYLITVRTMLRNIWDDRVPDRVLGPMLLAVRTS